MPANRSASRAKARALLPHAQAIADGILRALVHRVDVSGARSRVQIEAISDDVKSGVEFMQPYGLHTVPLGPSGDPAEYAEAVRVLVGSSPDHPVVILINDIRHRPSGWGEGDVGLYDHRDQFIRIRDGKVVVETPDDIELGEGATKGVAREGDAVQSDTLFDAWIGQVQTAINILAPGSITPLLSTMDGTITSASTTVKAKD